VGAAGHWEFSNGSWGRAADILLVNIREIRAAIGAWQNE
jgi:hypothetical protein